jgi:hypothetical protein
MLTGRGWGIVKTKLDSKILDLQNINNLDFTSEQTVLFDLRARKMAADILFQWLKDDVYGFADQQAANTIAMMDAPDNGFIERHKEN